MKPRSPVLRRSALRLSPLVNPLVWSLLAIASIGGLPGLALAAAEPASVAPAAVAAQPAPPAPTGPFPPPPPRLSDQAGAEEAGFPPGDELPWTGGVTARGDERETSFRRLSFTAAVGPGMLAGPGERSLAMSYQLFRVGVGLNQRLAIV